MFDRRKYNWRKRIRRNWLVLSKNLDCDSIPCGSYGKAHPKPSTGPLPIILEGIDMGRADPEDASETLSVKQEIRSGLNLCESVSICG